MKILWIVNVALPEVCALQNISKNPYGGWLINASDYLARENEVELHVVFPHNSDSKFIQGEDIIYHGIKVSPQFDENVANFEGFIKDINPDLIHLFGTELPHALPSVRAATKLNVNVIVSIQGLVSVYKKHLFADLPFSVIYGMTLRNALNLDSIYLQERLLNKRGREEERLLKEVSYVIGRTKWDKTCVENVNDCAEYFHCNETLRKSFYQHKWNVNSMTRHKIFISQGHYSIKGLHYVLEAISLLVAEYPSIQVCVGGKNILDDDKRYGVSLRSKYANYIRKLIGKFQITKNIKFLGALDEAEMVKEYLDSHLYICSSTIENSPNSLGEAMILGVPCIASFVGGIPDLIKNEVEGILYQHNAPYMMAKAISRVFNSDELALTLSENSIKRAQNTHDELTNNDQLVYIYDTVIRGRGQ